MKASVPAMLSMNKPYSLEVPIHFMVALSREARPLIKHYHLSRLPDEKAFPIYSNDSISLTVTGVGKTAMAAGVAYTHALSNRSKTSGWLNIGVAGHPDLPVGQACLAHKITDQDRGRNWYPPIIAKPPCCTESLITWSCPQTDYEPVALYDMEASGFYETACRFSSSERVQCFKIVSDNRARPADFLQADQVTELLENRIGLIDRLLEQQKQLAIVPEAPNSERVEQFVRRWHFSVQQTLQLDSLLHRWILLDPNQSPDPDQLDHLKNGRQVLAYLRERVDNLPLLFA
ncbi:MAG: hypothetical protein ACRESZ_10600 [Methylococcales bacterium]